MIEPGLATSSSVVLVSAPREAVVGEAPPLLLVHYVPRSSASACLFTVQLGENEKHSHRLGVEQHGGRLKPVRGRMDVG
ncbi:hypothetical protein ElyMa_000707400 [Elysia marginata]|uniref:Uncharacterized protein n=1 Tax=Elysia marginata TaxID=1093978 RepID=A0AAV4GKU5_9GAST|nr:hypothetical protein ElyMa_000707400 [Elysia marginata]